MRRLRLPLIVVLALLSASCAAERNSSEPTNSTAHRATGPAAPRPHPQVVEPVAGEVSQGTVGNGAAAGNRAPGVVSVGPVHGNLPRPVSDTVIRQQLLKSGLTANPNQATLTADGLAIPPLDAPPAVQAVIEAGNEIANLPYRWGGGHVTFEDTAYDCSGSISFVFEAAHLLSGSIVSGGLMNWGRPGPGKWITVFANAGHTFMYVAGLRFDTVALAETGDRWSTRSADESDLSTFAVRHPPGL